MANFYGFTDSEMELMTSDIFQDYWLAIESIESILMLNQMSIISYPSLKQSDREKLFNKLNKKTQSIMIRKKGLELKTEDAAKLIAESLKNVR